jgi:hypothetical protein
MKTYGGVEVWVHSYLALPLDRGTWSASCSFTHGERTMLSSRQGLMVLLPILTAWRKETVSTCARNQTVDPRSWHRYYTNWHMSPYDICTIIPIIQCHYKCLLLRKKCVICSLCLKLADSCVSISAADLGHRGPTDIQITKICCMFFGSWSLFF